MKNSKKYLHHQVRRISFHLHRIWAHFVPYFRISTIFMCIYLVTRHNENNKNMFTSFNFIPLHFENHQFKAKVEDTLQQNERETIPEKVLTDDLELHWSENNFNDKVCRIRNACIRSDGTVIVSSRLQSSTQILKSCGIKSVGFMGSDPCADRKIRNHNYDIFGFSPARWHMPHFLTNIMPMIYASELLQPSLNHTYMKKSCFSTGKIDCKRSSSPSGSIKAALYVDNRISGLPVSEWVPRVAAMLPGAPYLFSTSLMFQKQRDLACFKSVIAYNHDRTLRRGRSWFSSRTSFFYENGIQRNSVISSSRKIRRSKCKLQIVVLDRRSSEGRNICNIKTLIDHIRMRSFNRSFVDVSVETYYFNDISFEKQVKIMQSADIVLGVHGAALSNLIFCRLDVGVIEIFPFSYYAGPFENVARTLYLPYSSTVAKPDTLGFKRCLSRKISSSAKETLKIWGTRWNSASIKWENQVYTNIFTHNISENISVGVRECARLQELFVDVYDIQRKLVQHASRICE